MGDIDFDAVGSQLRSAVYFNKVDDALAILSADLPCEVLNHPDSVGNLPLVLACLNNPRIAMALIEGGADVEVSDSAGWTPLSAAQHSADKKGLNMTEVIAALHAKAHEQRVILQGNLLAAINNDDEDAALNLLSRPNFPRSALDQVDGCGDSPLVLACTKNYPAIALRLIESGADVLKRDESGSSPMDAAQASLDSGTNMSAVIDALNARIEAFEVELRDKLHMAAYNSEEEEAMKILDYDNISMHVLDPVDTTGNVTLILACLNVPDVAARMMYAGANFKVTDGGGFDVPAALSHAESKGKDVCRARKAYAERTVGGLDAFDFGGALVLSPTLETPIDANSSDAKTIRSLSMLLEAFPAHEIPAHPAAAYFPGVPSEEDSQYLTSITIGIDASFERISHRYLYASLDQPVWRSTGAYVPPGMVAAVILPAAAHANRMSIRVGCHTDLLWDRPTFGRFPAVTRVFPVSRPEDGSDLSVTQVACAFGGLLYICVPAGTNLGCMEVTINGVLPAPWFQLDARSANEQWEEGENSKYAPAPWGEIAGVDMIWTLPSALLREVNEPEKIAHFWDSVVGGDIRLLGAEPRPRPERFVVDRALSCGIGHSGYPLMAEYGWGPGALQIPYGLEAYPDVDIWGYFHEIGHNHQEGEWTPAGMTEVTVNLFTVYTIEQQALDIGYVETPILNDPEIIKKRYKEFIDSGAKDFGNHFRAGLHFWLELKNAFGWEAFTRLFKDFRAMPDSERTKDEKVKMQQLITKGSVATEHNLAPYFSAWGFTVEPDTQAAVKHLPEFNWVIGAR